MFPYFSAADSTRAKKCRPDICYGVYSPTSPQTKCKIYRTGTSRCCPRSPCFPEESVRFYSGAFASPPNAFRTDMPTRGSTPSHPLSLQLLRYLRVSPCSSGSVLAHLYAVLNRSRPEAASPCQILCVLFPVVALNRVCC